MNKINYLFYKDLNFIYLIIANEKLLFAIKFLIVWIIINFKLLWKRINYKNNFFFQIK
jgi:hypothetical protein